ncbi:hypothetical protein [Halolactibacillus halophilus]|uniref:hypothetical protein n=1 Tax=Halolactibacillus halophilus TaxID=306540 RepID=UPI001F45A4DF|nr:hypothetical protein [Halolactibacillus halophilus]
MHIVTFIVLRHYYLKQQAYHKEQQKFQEEKKELEQLLMSYLIEMKEENDRLLQVVQSNTQRPSAPKAKEQPASTSFYQENKQTETINASKTVTKEEPEYRPLVDAIEDEPVAYKKSYQAEIIDRYARGETPEMIAKAMDRGKTEVELIIKFHKK